MLLANAVAYQVMLLSAVHARNTAVRARQSPIFLCKAVAACAHLLAPINIVVRHTCILA